MKQHAWAVLIAVLVGTIGVACNGSGETSIGDSGPVGTANYGDLLELFLEFRSVETPTTNTGLPDYTVPAMSRQRDQLNG
ncbi:MAG: hypothetical protein VX398_03720, partial [Acidobacteriota bacterium]|nr:hypothetical protein [Acidobacteriota bacterium]